MASPVDIRLIVNQVFGRQPNYEITLKNPKRGYKKTNKPLLDSEFILVYSRTDNFIYNTLYLPLTEELRRRYSHSDNPGPYLLTDLTTPFDRPAANFAWRGYRIPSGRSWRYTPDKLEELVQAGLIHFPANDRGLPTMKRYLSEHPGVELGTIWDDISSHLLKEERTQLSIQRPLAILNRIVELSSNIGDVVLEPFCRAGTALVAAEGLGRKWIGIDSDPNAIQETSQRLSRAHNLEPNVAYKLLDEINLAQSPPIGFDYKNIIHHVIEIEELQERVKLLTDHLFTLRMLMNIPADVEQDELEDVIGQMTEWIDKVMANQRTADSYILNVRQWSIGWEQLHGNSQVFLPQAELLFESITRTEGKDYSPFILQYCRALENEILIKLFLAYTDDVYNRIKDVKAFVDNDFDAQSDDGKEKLIYLAKSLKKRECKYTLGAMNFILNLLKPDGSTFKRSAILQDLREFVSTYFSTRILEKEYLEQIRKISNDFRNKSAHPYLLDKAAAQQCRDLIRNCLNVLIYNYKGATG